MFIPSGRVFGTAPCKPRAVVAAQAHTLVGTTSSALYLTPFWLKEDTEIAAASR